MYIRYICIFYFILLQSARLLLKAPLLSPFCLVSRQTHNQHWDIFHVWDWGVGFEEAVASQTECQAVFCFFSPVESNPCDVCCLPQAGLGLGLTSKSCYTLSWRRLVMVLFLFKRPELMRKNKYWWWYWNISNEIYLWSFSGQHLSLLSFAFTPLLSCNPLFKQKKNPSSHSQTVSSNKIHQLGFMIKTWKTWCREK